MDPVFSGFCIYCSALTETCLAVQKALVAAAAEFDLPVTERLHEWSVDEYIRDLKQLAPAVFIAVFVKLLKGVAGIRHHIQAKPSDLSSKRCKSLRLTEGFAAAEGHAVQQRIALYLFQQSVCVSHLSTGEIMSLGVMASRAIVWTALNKNGKPYAWSVNDRVIDGACYPEFHYITLHVMFYTVVLLCLLAVIEAVKSADEIACDTADTVESNVV